MCQVLRSKQNTRKTIFFTLYVCFFRFSFDTLPFAVYPFASAFLQKNRQKKINKLTHFFIHKTSSHIRLSHECAIDPKALAAELSFSFGFRCQTGKKHTHTHTQCESIQKTWIVEQVLMTALFFGLIDCSLLWFSYFLHAHSRRQFFLPTYFRLFNLLRGNRIHVIIKNEVVWILSHFSCEIFNKSHAIFVPFFLHSFFFQVWIFLQSKCCRCRDYSRNLLSFSAPFSFKFIFKFVHIKRTSE